MSDTILKTRWPGLILGRGQAEYRLAVVYPRRAPFDLWDREQRHGKNFSGCLSWMMRNALMPRYLRFVRGVIDSNDLPLNISRELLQGSKVVDSIRAGSVKESAGSAERSGRQ